MGLFKKVFASFTGGADLSDAQLYEGARVRPALAFAHPAGGPNFVKFDALRVDEQGKATLSLDLQGALATPGGQSRLLLALEALQQNDDALCEIVLLRADFAEYKKLLASIKSSHFSALSRVQLLVATDA